MNKPIPEDEFKRIYSRVPRATVSLAIKTKGGVVLTLRSLSHWNNQWHLPGGTIFYKETVKNAIARIAKEELGIKVKFLKMIGWIEYPSEEKERGFGWSIDIVALCEYKGTKFKLNNEATEVSVFKKLPRNTIKEQKKFLMKNL